MPLDEDEWNEATPATSDADMVYEFLRDNPARAYSASEIMYEHTGMDPDSESAGEGVAQAILVRYFEAILQLLLERGDVEQRIRTERDDSGEERTVSYYRVDQ